MRTGQDRLENILKCLKVQQLYLAGVELEYFTFLHFVYNLLSSVFVYPTLLFLPENKSGCELTGELEEAWNLYTRVSLVSYTRENILSTVARVSV